MFSYPNIFAWYKETIKVDEGYIGIAQPPSPVVCKSFSVIHERALQQLEAATHVGFIISSVIGYIMSKLK